MEGFTPYEKLSKKKKKELDRARRGTWGGASPVMRTPPDPRTYRRAKLKAELRRRRAEKAEES